MAANLWCSATLNASASGLHNAPMVLALIVVLRPDDLQVEVNGLAACRAMATWPRTSPTLEMVCLLKKHTWPSFTTLGSHDLRAVEEFENVDITVD